MNIKYQIFKISKKNGKHRVIYSIDTITKKILTSLLPTLQNIYDRNNVYNNNYGFIKGRNCVQNALSHIGYNFTLSMDIENFFDSVSESHVKHIIPSAIIQKCFIDGAPRQGLPTSPIIATIAFLKCDNLIIKRLKENNLKVVYTRYADDMTFSFNHKEDLQKIKFIVKQTIEEFNFKVNEKKTSMQDIKNGRIIITGIAVDKYGLYSTRKIKKKIRAAIHQNNLPSELGLREWAMCKLPNRTRNKDMKNG